MKCLYEDYCTLHNTSECNMTCPKFRLVQFLLDTSLIPRGRQKIQQFNIPDEDKRVYETLSKICGSIKKYVDNGTNFVLYSENTGNGKTSWAIKMMIAYFNEIWCNNGFKPRGYFIHVPTYLNRLKASMKNQDDSLSIITKNLTDIDLVILDDIGTNALSDFDISTLTYIIDQRCLNQKSTIYTTNRDRKKLEDILGHRIVDRMFDGCVLHFTSSSNRGLL